MLVASADAVWAGNLLYSSFIHSLCESSYFGFEKAFYCRFYFCRHNVAPESVVSEALLASIFPHRFFFSETIFATMFQDNQTAIRCWILLPTKKNSNLLCMVNRTSSRHFNQVFKNARYLFTKKNAYVTRSHCWTISMRSILTWIVAQLLWKKVFVWHPAAWKISDFVCFGAYVRKLFEFSAY